MELHPSLLLDTVAEALSGHRCVSAWLGIGNALFLGFGTESIAPRTAEGRRTQPPYELQTSMAGWRVAGDAGATSDGEAGPAGLAVESLIGRSVECWRLPDGGTLQVEFEGGWLLEVVPPTETDSDDIDLDLWWIRLPGGSYVGIGSGERIIAGDSCNPFGNSA